MPATFRGKWLGALLLVCFVGAVCSSSTFAYENRELAEAARAYEEEIKSQFRERHGRLSPRDLLILETVVEPLLFGPSGGMPPRPKDMADVLFAYQFLIAQGRGSFPTWLKLARANSALESLSQLSGNRRYRWLDSEGRFTTPILAVPKLPRASQAAYRAYEIANNDLQRASALGFLSAIFNRLQKPYQALLAIREAHRLASKEKARRPGAVLNRLVASLEQEQQRLERNNQLVLLGVRVLSNRLKPLTCLTFSGNLAGVGERTDHVRYPDYIKINPAVQVAFNPKGKDLCIEGLSHGNSYLITVLKGMPNRQGLTTYRTFTRMTIIPNRPPRIAFRNSAYVLPARKNKELPLTSINVERVGLWVYRIVERNLIHQIVEKRITRQLNSWNLGQIKKKTGELLWKGEMDVEGKTNEETRTSIPLAEILKDKLPGIYVVSAKAGGQIATQWLVLSDVGISTLKGSDGLYVFVRSLQSAKPVPSAEVRLVARNNKVLGTVTTDDQGGAKFSPGLVRGRGGNAPVAVMVYVADKGTSQGSSFGDFNFIDLTGPAMDLTDRGVAGRPAPGPLDAYLYTDRGVYRPGERVHLMALLRDNTGNGVSSVPITLKVFRPDAVEFRRFVRTTDAGGGGYQAIRLPRSVRTGAWRVTAHVDESAQPIGQAEFQVEDFVPERIKVELQASAKILKPQISLPIQVKGTYLYGAAASSLKAEAEVVLLEEKNPHPAHSGYRFGKVKDKWTAKRIPIQVPATNKSGETRVIVRVGTPGETTKPLKAVVRVNLFEKGGRPARKSVTLPFRYRPFDIGIRPHFKDHAIEEGQEARFSILAVGPESELIAAKGLRYSFYEEQWDYVWHTQGGRWTYRTVFRDRLIAQGDVVLDGNRPASFSRRVSHGRYRFEVFDPKKGAASSVRFRAGWFVSSSLGNTPDRLEVTMDKETYRPGARAQVHIKPDFDAEVLLTVVNHRVHEKRTLRVPASGKTISIKVSESWGVGAYVMATAYRPGDAARRRGPGRAIGIVWAAVRSSDQVLDLSIKSPAQVLPKTTVRVPVQIQGYKGNEPVFITLAAVDEGILSLTAFKNPDPRLHFFGKRRLSVDLHDIYGKLIDANADYKGRLRSGGGKPEEAERHLISTPATPVSTFRTVAFFSGRVEVNSEGVVSVPLEIPDFNGQLRLMAVAYGKKSLGTAKAFMEVREPLVTQVSLPRFLAPGDEVSLSLSLHNFTAPAGSYAVWFETSGAIQIARGPSQKINLSPGDRKTTFFRLSASAIGRGHIRLHVRGPGEYALERKWEIGVRSGQPIITETMNRALKQGEEMKFGKAIMAKYLPSSSQLFLTMSSLPNVNASGLLRDLDRYPYGCLEQVTSRALPLLYLGNVAKRYKLVLWGKKTITQRIQTAIERVLDLQLHDGSFALWNGHGRTEEWLTPFAMDFLVRARWEKHFVPSNAYQNGLEWLKRRVGQGRALRLPQVQEGQGPMAVRAYALYVLAKAGVGKGGDLRYFYATHFDDLPTVLAQAQIAGALALTGQRKLAVEAFEKALRRASHKDGGRTAIEGASPTQRYYDYGSPLRDLAGLSYLIAESGLMKSRVFKLAEEVASRLAAKSYTSTQEKSWLLLAAHAISKNQPEMHLSLKSKAVSSHQEPLHLSFRQRDLEEEFSVRNEGVHSVSVTTSIHGAPKDELPPVSSGLSIEKRYYTMDGKELRPGPVRQGKVLVVLIEGSSNTRLNHQAMIVDLLPAGFEIENTRLEHTRSLSDMSWIGKLTQTEHTGLRDDRFVAAVNLTKERNKFRIAYLVQVVTPGEYYAPAAFVEDMYKPRYRALGSPSRVTVLRSLR